jgi:hypothetical protein
VDTAWADVGKNESGNGGAAKYGSIVPSLREQSEGNDGFREIKSYMRNTAQEK